VEFVHGPEAKFFGNCAYRKYHPVRIAPESTTSQSIFCARVPSKQKPYNIVTFGREASLEKPDGVFGRHNGQLRFACYVWKLTEILANLKWHYAGGHSRFRADDAEGREAICLRHRTMPPHQLKRGVGSGHMPARSVPRCCGNR